MLINCNPATRPVENITPQQEERIKDFLQGAVYAWCNCNGIEPFFFYELMGGENYYWNNTPLIVLYEKHINNCKDEKEAICKAGKDAGMLLKMVLRDDKNKTFGMKKEGEDIPRNQYYFIH
jgi:hypothetical protein